MSQTRIRIGIIGAGGNTRLRHIPGFQDVGGVEVAVICNRSEESSQRVADEFGVSKISTSWLDVVADPDLDAICIGTWPYLHADITIAALESGKHVLTEARMARNLEEAQSMAIAAEENSNLVAQIVPAPFSLDYDATIKRLLKELGAVREVSVVHRFGAGANADAAKSWRQDFDLSGYNTHTLGIHFETVQRWLGAEVDPAWLIADAELFVEERPSADDIAAKVTIPDAVSVLGRYNNGAKFNFDISSIDCAAPVNEIRLNTEGGCLRFDFSTEELFLADTASKKESKITPDTGTDLGWCVEADFIESIRSGKAVELTSFDDGLRYMRFTEMVWQSWSNQCARQEW
ncbi:Gfo/Idh/MocA family oxidoreductase [Rubellicoccus peritrichatus]|uniref:Gfo/Idh/MocA family oxidoreductase n=1 Tax=Rubellicoccus peritrichatus TaxID=3080537 RepID=A0AAQ3LAS1_9BACT|nr:Gfo/Idh/MocA family oxidoreductase [Puniceicoccus sp. CR14]WOO40792.1 Gfo/Idh/MocA family oxidoreductase [Puniceicoccus sp. CR14]